MPNQVSLTRCVRPPTADLIFAAAMASYALYDVLISKSWTGPLAVNAVVVTAMTASLGFRRTLPLTVLIINGASIVSLGILYGSAQAWSSVFPFVIAVYSAAAYGRKLWVVIAFVIATVVLRDSFDPNVKSISDSLFSSTLALLSILSGLEGRRMQRRTINLDSRAEILAKEETRLTALAVAKERQRIARELHDIISHGLGVMVLQAGAAEQVINADPAQARLVLGSIRSIGQEAIGELSALLGLVGADAESSLEPQPTLADLPMLIERARLAGMNVGLDLAIGDASLSPGLELSVYRIVQEGLTNAAKYATKARIEVNVSATDQLISVAVLDDGKSTTVAPGSRRGLAGVAERVSIFGGQLRAGPRERQGWAIEATLPIRR